MTRVSLFNSPLLLGFEQFEQALDRISKTASDGYPPYNVEQVDDHRLRITLAVAGFGAGELEVQIQDSQLVIRGKQQDDGGKQHGCGHGPANWETIPIHDLTRLNRKKSSTRYRQGMIRSEKQVEAMIPPMMVRARGPLS